MADPTTTKKDDEQEFTETLVDILPKDTSGVSESQAEYTQFQSPLGTLLSDMFFKAERDRKSFEDRWVKDLLQYRGEYEPEVLARMDPKRSQAFMRITRTKVKTVDARLSDLLFPANGEKNWGVEPTPVPEVDPETKKEIADEVFNQTGTETTDEELEHALDMEVRKASDLMELEIEDQLSELRYRDIIRKAIHSGNLYGTGVLKGPLVQSKQNKRWMSNSDGEWQTSTEKTLTPYVEWVSLWDIYPDLSAKVLENARYIFQRYVMPKHKVLQLAKRDDFNAQAINSYVTTHPQGDAMIKTHEQNLQNIPSADARPQLELVEKYDLKEYWGYVSREVLVDAEVEVPDDGAIEYAANIWMIGDIIIKAILSPIESVTFPYFFYYFDEDETSLFGEGIPSIMRDPQKLFNASVRAMLDNAAISAGPIIEVNLDLLAEGEDPKDIHPFKVFQRTGEGIEASSPAIRVDTLPSYTPEYLKLADYFMQMADESTTIPRYLQGDMKGIGGAGKTATGLSMMMGAANITLKDQVKNFDDGITKPFIRAMYFWNMEFNSKSEIKGDYGVVAKGSTNLIANEVKMERLNQFMMLAQNETYSQYLHLDKVLLAVVEQMELDHYGFVKTPTELSTQRAAQAAVAQDQAQAEEEAEQLRAESSGHIDKGRQSVDNPGKRPTLGSVDQQAVRQGEIPDVKF